MFLSGLFFTLFINTGIMHVHYDCRGIDYTAIQSLDLNLQHIHP